MSNLKGQINPHGFIKLLDLYTENLLTRNTVAQFTDYELAKQDVIMELGRNMDQESMEAMRYAISVYEETTYVKEWFNEL